MLEKIYIENYLSIFNKQELKVSNRITTLIGGNASGKTTVLKSIEKLNGSKIDVKEKNINGQNNATSILAKFKLDNKIVKKLNNNHLKQFPDANILFPNKNYYYYLEVSDDGELIQSIVDELENEIDLLEISMPKISKKIMDKVSNIQNENLVKKLNDLSSNKDTIANILFLLTEEEKNLIDEEVKKMIINISDEIKNYKKTLLPDYKFIYMNSFKHVLVDEISIDEIEKNKTVLNFLTIAGITKEEIISAVNEDNQQKIRTIDNKTVSVVTEHFRKVFSQVKDDQFFKISMTIDTKNRKLNFWIQNKVTGESVLPFTSESEGMQWYLSMYLTLYNYFENKEDNIIYILLLDEPNIYLHAEAQFDLLQNVFKKKLRDIQIIYSTHSPYMIDAEDLFSLRVIDKDNETKIYNNTIEFLKSKRKNESLNDIDVLSPVLLATGINISNQLVISPGDKIIVVEGPHDYYMLSTMKDILKIDKSIKIIPCQGASKVPYMCGYLYGLGYSVTAVLDNDIDGKRAVEELKYQNEELKLIHAIFYQKKNLSNDSCLLEDLFSENDRKTYMNEKSTINYRNIYDSRKKIKLEKETINNFKNIFDLIKNTFEM